MTTLLEERLRKRLAEDVDVWCSEGFISIMGQRTIAILQTGLGLFGITDQEDDKEGEFSVVTHRLDEVIREYRAAASGFLEAGFQRRTANPISELTKAAFRILASYDAIKPQKSNEASTSAQNLASFVTTQDDTAEIKTQERENGALFFNQTLQSNDFYGMKRRKRPENESIPKAGLKYVAEPEIVNLPARVFARGQRPLLVTGPSGSGKSQFVEWLACESGLKFYWFLHHAQTETDDIIGKVVQNEQGRFVFRDGPLTMAVEHGGLYFADEITTSLPGVNMVYQDVLNGNPLLVAGDEGYRRIAVHPEFRFVASTNPWREYEGHHGMNLAQIGRFVVVPWWYPSAEYEIQAVLRNEPKIGRNTATSLVAMANRIREGLKKQDDARFVVSTRDLVKIAELVTTVHCSLTKAIQTCLVEPAEMFEPDSAKIIAPIIHDTFGDDE